MLELIQLNDSYCKVQYSKDDIEDFSKLYNFFKIFNPKLKFTPKVRSGLDDGKRPFVKKNGQYLYGIHDKIKKFLDDNDIEYKDHIQDISQTIDDKDIKKFFDSLDLPFEPYKHQLTGFKRIFEKKRIVTQLATSAGKSCILYAVARYSIAKNKNFLLIVPDIGLLQQMKSDFLDYFYTKENNIKEELDTEIDKEKIKELEKSLSIIHENRKRLKCQRIEDHIHTIMAGEEKETDTKVVISTWQSIYKLDTEYFKRFDILGIDETHLAAADSIQAVANAVGQDKLSDTIKFGMTGTLPTDTYSQLLIEGALGNTEVIVTPKELIEMGLATKTTVQPIVLKYTEDERKSVRKMDWHEETKFIVDHEKRLDFIVKLALRMSKKGNVLVLAKNIAYQDKLYEAIKVLNKNTYLISGKVKAKQREQNRQDFDKNEGSILIGSMQIVSTGLNLKSLKYGILAQVVKSEIKTIQTLGRAMRLHDSKSQSIIFDIADDLTYTTRTGREYPNYFLKHFRERMNSYIKYEFDVSKPAFFTLETSLF